MPHFTRDPDFCVFMAGYETSAKLINTLVRQARWRQPPESFMFMDRKLSSMLCLSCSVITAKQTTATFLQPKLGTALASLPEQSSPFRCQPPKPQLHCRFPRLNYAVNLVLLPKKKVSHPDIVLTCMDKDIQEIMFFDGMGGGPVRFAIKD